MDGRPFDGDPADLIEFLQSEEFDGDSTQEEINMANKTSSQPQPQEVDIRLALHQLLGTVSQYPLQNVLQRLMQSMVTEIARAQHLADRIELGDEVMFDASKPQAPGVDQDTYQRTLSERQLEILVQCQNDQAELTAALVEVKNFYTYLLGESVVTYAIRENGHGGWDQVTDFNQAKETEYRKAHIAWMKRQSEARAEGFTPEGAEEARKAAQERAAKLAASL